MKTGGFKKRGQIVWDFRYEDLTGPNRSATQHDAMCVDQLYAQTEKLTNRANSNSNSTFIALNLRHKTDSKAHHTKTLFNIQKPETLQGSALRRKQKGDWKFRVGMLFQRGMTSTLT